ncbi:MAG: hypothetical protein HDR29_01600 [Lachnospiraceae bacterium]|nr:hypothetical protein [Lachnospiraceae bacterium]
MKKSHDYLFIAAFIMMAVLVAAAAFKAYDNYVIKKDEQEFESQEMAAVFARNAESQRRVTEMEAEIAQMVDDLESLQTFINDTVAAANEVQCKKKTLSVSENAVSVLSGEPLSGSVSDNIPVYGAMNVSGNYTVSGDYVISGNGLYIDGMAVSGNGSEFGAWDGSGGLSVSGDDAESGAVPVLSGSVLSGNGTFGNGVLSKSISGNGIFDSGVSGNGAFGSGVSGNGAFGSGVSGNEAFENDISGNSISGNSVSGNMTVSVNDAGDSYYGTWQYEPPKMSLEDRRALKTSYEETLEVNNVDREMIAANQYDFSQMKIACLGDSITAASNLENEENYTQYSYPSVLGELLGAGEVVNLGIGGSSIGRYWADAYVERYMQIPEDTDIIIVMGGTNDGFCVSDNEFGNLNERAPRTFCGDVNELMKGLRENYPQAVIFFATPLPNVLHDYLMSEKEYLLPQRYFADVIRTIAREYGIETIDLYNSNILDSHDANIVAQYMPDGVHGNHEGYRIIAEHFAAGIVEYLDNCETTSE